MPKYTFIDMRTKEIVGYADVPNQTEALKQAETTYPERRVVAMVPRNAQFSLPEIPFKPRRSRKK